LLKLKPPASKEAGDCAPNEALSVAQPRTRSVGFRLLLKSTKLAELAEARHPDTSTDVAGDNETVSK
jgi:hypothetical protein